MTILYLSRWDFIEITPEWLTLLQSLLVISPVRAHTIDPVKSLYNGSKITPDDTMISCWFLLHQSFQSSMSETLSAAKPGLDKTVGPDQYMNQLCPSALVSASISVKHLTPTLCYNWLICSQTLCPLYMLELRWGHCFKLAPQVLFPSLSHWLSCSCQVRSFIVGLWAM